MLLISVHSSCLPYQSLCSLHLFLRTPEIEKLTKRLSKRNVKLVLDDDAKAFLVDKGYDSALGARPVKRVVQDFVEDPLADAVLSGKLKKVMRGRLDSEGKKLKF